MSLSRGRVIFDHSRENIGVICDRWLESRRTPRVSAPPSERRSLRCSIVRNGTIFLEKEQGAMTTQRPPDITQLIGKFFHIFDDDGTVSRQRHVTGAMLAHLLIV